jgi:hypothetical protein
MAARALSSTGYNGGMATTGPVLARGADPTTGATVLAATIAATALVAAHVIGKATRESLFLTHFPVTRLPLAMTATSVLSAVAVSTLSRGMMLAGPRAVVWRLLALQTVAFCLEWLLALRFEETASVVVYLHTGSLGAAIVSAFWLVVGESFDPHTAKRALGRVGGGAALGGALGGGLAWAGSRVTSVPTMLLAMAVLNGVCAWKVRDLARRAPAGIASSSSRSSARPPACGFAALRDTPYLRMLALLVTGGALLQSLLDYALGAQAVAEYGRGPRLLSFFAVFQTAVGVLSFLLQSAANRAALDRLGVGGTMALLPLSVAGLGAVAVGVPSLATTAVQRGAEGVLRGSLFRSAYEVLFTPVPPSLRRATKTWIDVSFDRAGLLLGSGLTMGLVALWPHAGVRPVTLASLVAASLELVFAYELHRGYVDTLAQRLRSGVLHLDLGDILDATTRKTVSRTLSSIDRAALLAQIEASRAPRPPAPDEQEVQALLERLDRDDLAADAMRALSQVAPRVVGAIADALLDEERSPRARRRAARLLGGVPTDRSALALVHGLDARSLEVRHACGRALVEMRARNAALSFEASAMFARATRELASSTDDDPRSIEHVFDVLSLTAARETLQLAYGALQSRDAFLQGVALEYLDVALPPEVRAAMLPRLSASTAPSAPPASRRGARSLDDLLRSGDKIRLHLDELRRARDPDADRTGPSPDAKEG